MFLKTFDIKNFRNIPNLSIDFRKGINIFVGQNNDDMSALTDALKICFNFSKQRKDICVKRNDFYINDNDLDTIISPIEFDLIFEIESSKDIGDLFDLTFQSEDGNQQRLKIHYEYYVENKDGLEEITYSVRGEDNEGKLLTPEIFNLIHFVNLTAHVDEVELDWNGNSGIVKQKTNDDSDENSMANYSIENEFIPHEFKIIFRNLRTILSACDLELFEDGYNELGGQGYQKLINLEEELEDFKKFKYMNSGANIVLLIEESESQLQPRLHNIYLNYLEIMDSIGIQVIINSRSTKESVEPYKDKYKIMETILNDYIEILTRTIVSEHINNNDELKTKIFLELIFENKTESLTTLYKNFMMPKQVVNLDSIDSFNESLHNLYEETTLNHFKLLSVTTEKSFLRTQGFPENKKLNKEEAEELLLRIKKFNIKELEEELGKYDPGTLLFAFYGIADRLALLSEMTVATINNIPVLNNSISENNPFSILTTLISNMDSKGVLQTSILIGTEKKLNDILVNQIYKMYISSNQKEGREDYESDINIRLIYQLTYMISVSNLYLESNQLLYEQGEALIIKNYGLLQSGAFNEKMLLTQTDIVESDYREDIVKKVFKEYSKREGFCPDDLLQFTLISAQDSRAQIHMMALDRESLKKKIIQTTNVKEYGVDRFIDVLTLKKEIKEIAHNENKLSIRPFLELNDGRILYSSNLILQAFLMLESRMLQQSFTTNKKMQKFISKNYDEAGIVDLVQMLLDAKYPYLEHVKLDKISNKDIKNELSQKGITKEFDLIFIKNKTLFVVEYKTWKVSSYNIIQVLNEQKKITNKIDDHLRAIEIISNHPTEFKKLFGDEYNQYTNIELIMVFQNPTVSKYIVNKNNIQVISTKQFNEFILQ